MKKSVEEIIRKRIEQSHRWTRNGFTSHEEVVTDNGWYSTCQKDPLLGHIYFPVDNGPIIEFENKYGEKMEGILTSFSWDEKEKDMGYTVKCYQMLGDEMECVNHSVCYFTAHGRINEPQIPNLDTFK